MFFFMFRVLQLIGLLGLRILIRFENVSAVFRSGSVLSCSPLFLKEPA